MEKQEWMKDFEKQASELGKQLTQKEQEDFYEYMKLLQSWNQKMNLTAIIEPKEILQKHFIDSLTILPYISPKAKVIDVGTGAGFPGIPIAISNSEIEVILLDALNKRLLFLNQVIESLKLKNVQTLHARAEEVGKNKKYREQFDIATSRAVAPLMVLVEYLLPLVKIGGKCICMKGNHVQEELEDSKKAIEQLGGKIQYVQEIYLPNSDMKRTIILIEKVEKTPLVYPRKPGTPSKMPIL